MVYIYTFFDKNFFLKVLVFSKSFKKMKELVTKQKPNSLNQIPSMYP